MDPAANQTIVLMPIKPAYAQAIFDGRKKVEFRKVAFRSNVDQIIVYASSPEQRVLGCFCVSFVDSGSPSAIWSKYGNRGEISADDFRLYYQDKESAIAIGVGSVYRLTQPLRLEQICESLKVPQSFAYVGQEALKAILSSPGYLEKATPQPDR